MTMNIVLFPYKCVESFFNLITNKENNSFKDISTTEIVLGTSIYASASIFSFFYFFQKKKKEDYKIVLFPENNKNFQLNEVVYVLKDRKPFAKAKIIGGIEIDEKSEFFGRYHVEYLKSLSHFHCRPETLIKIELEKKIIFVCETTHEYRRLAKTQINENDRVLEIGSDFGDTTKILHEYCAKVIGVDKSKVHVDRAKKLYPEIQFECLDVFLKVDKLQEIGKNCNKVFIDINGNREYQSVIDLIRLVQDLFEPEAIFVKSQKMKELYK
jgi:hypothetical protein